VFGRTLLRGSRETAFVHAITSAGVVYAITQSCSSGQLSDCGCDRKYAVSSHMKPDAELIQAIEDQQTLEGGSMNAATSRTQWRWGGCSDNVGFGVAFARRFVDAPEVNSSSRSIRAVMNLHNNKAGREAIKRRMRLRCRCHGVSGSCELKTCWRTLPEFDQIGLDLKSKYEQSVPISGLVGRRSISLRRRRQGRGKLPIGDTIAFVSSSDQRRPTKDDLVHISKSPNYCVPDRHNGILGTSGRRCERNSNGPDSCDLLCCGRGFHTRIQRQLEQCHCKFEWCCHVTCSTCEQLVQVHTCK
jgi:wingless-type MMTV integration site family protein 16